MSGAVRAGEKPYCVIIRPVVTEKSTLMANGETKSGKSIVFEVAPAASKAMIRRAVEKVFNVNVIGVRVLNRKGSSGRLLARGKRAWHCATKRAYVRLQQGQDINFMDKTGG